MLLGRGTDTGEQPPLLADEAVAPAPAAAAPPRRRAPGHVQGTAADVAALLWASTSLGMLRAEAAAPLAAYLLLWRLAGRALTPWALQALFLSWREIELQSVRVSLPHMAMAVLLDSRTLTARVQGFLFSLVCSSPCAVGGQPR